MEQTYPYRYISPKKKANLEIDDESKLIFPPVNIFLI